MFICEILGLNAQRLGGAAGRGGPQRSKGGEIPAVTGSRYSHGMFEISELERQGFYPLFFKICLHQKKYIVLL